MLELGCAASGPRAEGACDARKDCMIVSRSIAHASGRAGARRPRLGLEPAISAIAPDRKATKRLRVAANTVYVDEQPGGCAWSIASKRLSNSKLPSLASGER